MSVLVLSGRPEDDIWKGEAERTIVSSGSTATCFSARSDDQAIDHRTSNDAIKHDRDQAGFPVMSPEIRIVLASSNAPLELIKAIYATPVGQASRKIMDITADGAGHSHVSVFFDIADMLIFSPAAFAACWNLSAIPKSLDDLLCAQSRLKRHNQGVVVCLPDVGGVALWADRTMVVAGATPGNTGSGRGRFSGAIAAAVDQRIGPEPAMLAALASILAVAP